MTIKMYAPWLTKAARIIDSNGNAISIDANGIVEVSESDFLTLLRQGFTSGGSAMPDFRRTAATNNANCTLVANAMAYGKKIYLMVSGAAAITATTETANNMIALIPNAKLWDTWMVRVVNVNSGNLTLAGGANVAFNGTAVIAANRWADYMAMVMDFGADTTNLIVFFNVGFGNAT
jgi:hypothetical protein